jgi:hypothetical protein
VYFLNCDECSLSRPYRLRSGARRNADLHKSLTEHLRISIIEKRKVKVPSSTS